MRLAEGLSNRRQATTPEDAKMAVRLFESEFMIKQVVKMFGYSFGTIRKMLHEQGVAMRATGIGKWAAADG